LNIKNYCGLLLVAFAAIISGCASTTQPSQGTQSAAKPEVPTLKVAVDCGACEVKATIPALIVEGYNEAAAKSGNALSTTKEANLTIKEYTARTDAARILAGALAGKDEIKAVIAYQGKNYAVEDYYRNAWLGIDTLAKKIGEMTFGELK
jgi:hypothetical protein